MLQSRAAPEALRVQHWSGWGWAFTKNSLHTPGQVLRTETEFAEAKTSQASAQGHRAIPSPHPHLWELSCRAPFFDQK